MRILIIEDDPRLARQITRELQRGNHDATARNDGAEGLEAALLDPPDLIVLDLNLPSMDGLGVLARLREAHSTARILILPPIGRFGVPKPVRLCTKKLGPATALRRARRE